MTQLLDNSDLVYWNYPDKTDQPTMEEVRGAVRNNSLWETDLPDITAEKAFRRAAVSMRDKATDTQVFSFESTLHVQLDRVLVDATDPRLNRTLSGVWKHDISDARKVVQVEGYDYNLTAELETSYRHAATSFSWADLGTFLKATFDNHGLGLHALRDGGCVYTAPSSEASKQLFDQVEAFCTRFGIAFLRWQTPNTEAHKDEIRRAVARTIKQEIDGHDEAVAAYTETVRAETISLRRSLMAQTAMRLVNLSAHLNGFAAGLAGRLDDLEATLKQLESAAMTYVPTGRRVMSAK